jgi:hypothetical protein
MKRFSQWDFASVDLQSVGKAKVKYQRMYLDLEHDTFSNHTQNYRLNVWGFNENRMRMYEVPYLL